MTQSNAKRGWTAAALVAAVLLLGTSAHAQFKEPMDSEDAWDTKLLKNMMKGMGLRSTDDPGIEYRERSPLVVPASRNLPSPQDAAAAAAKSPAWPNDPDVKRAKEAKAAKAKRKSLDEESYPSKPGELNQARAARPGDQAIPDTRDPSNPSPWSELGSKSMFTWGGLWGQGKQEYATFTTEPPRSSLTQPPAGYRTPSPSHPYGVGPAKGQAINPLDTEGLRGTN